LPLSITCNTLVSTNGGASFMSFPIPCLPLHTTYIISIVISNSGQGALDNVTITNLGGFGNCFVSPLNLGTLAVGASRTVNCTNSCATAGTNSYSFCVGATASQSAGHVCVYDINGILMTVQNCCSAVVCCKGNPRICVDKEVACALGGTNCGTFSKFASGVQGTHADGTVQEPAFCYQVTLVNCGSDALTNVTVSDTNISPADLTPLFVANGLGPIFLPGASITVVFTASEGTTDNTITFVTNTVVASGNDINDGTPVSTNSSAAIEVVPAKVSCDKYYTLDGVATNDATVTCDTTTHTVVWYLTITNTGIANLLDLTIVDNGTGGSCSVAYSLRELPRGASTTFALCTNASFVCTNCFVAAEDTVDVTAHQFTLTVGTNEIPLCATEITGPNATNISPITASSECSAMLTCTTPTACRVTGGGRQDLSDPNGSVCPTDVRYVTHGGQVGAPVGDKVCAIDTTLPEYWLGNPCIHGRWTHVRHQQGGGEGNFHARFFDTLDCACLDTNANPVTCQYGTLTTVNGVCGDRSTGPLPRKAPANKIVFTGVGDWTCEKGGRESRACLFRVDIEDRGEPGNAHALTADKKPNRIPDRYRIRIWVLTPDEKAQLDTGSGADPYLIHFRDCIGACNGIDYKDGVCGPNTCSGDTCTGLGATGTITFPGGCPVRSPNIDDGGEMLHGNHQIHPQIKACDPHNPQAPPLAKP
jgi:hypothetical protein